MKTEAYISSGTLELYALGELSNSETQEVEQLLEKHPELRIELEKIELAMEALYQQSKVQPNEITKSKVLSSLSTKVSHSGTFNLSQAASISMTIISVGLSIFFYARWSSTKNELVSIKTENLRMADHLNQVNAEYHSLDEQITVLTDKNFVPVTLSGTDNNPSAQAVVYWNDQTNDLYLGGVTLQSLSKDQQYQLWAIIDGEPTSLGVFDAYKGLWAKMKDFDGQPAAFAVTIEVSGGSETPTLETMQVLGTTGIG